MPETVELLERPRARKMVMIAGWRQWADAGSTSSGLPQYIVRQTSARRIGTLRPDGFYLFQIPGTHDLVRPVIKHDDGITVSLETPHNDLFYTTDGDTGIVIFLGDEPHMDIERYTSALLDAAAELRVKRIIGLGGVYGELPYDKERTVSCSYSLRTLRDELNDLAVSFSNYEGGASIGSVLCHRAGERGMEYVGLYAFVPTYDFSNFAQISSAIRIENDFMAWLGVMRRVNHMLSLNFDLGDLEEKSAQLRRVMSAKIDELDQSAPQTGLRDYFAALSDSFDEVRFEPLPDVWEVELRRILNHDDAGADSDGDSVGNSDAESDVDPEDKDEGDTKDENSSADS